MGFRQEAEDRGSDMRQRTLHLDKKLRTWDLNRMPRTALWIQIRTDSKLIAS
jgi:hypothetical protein